MSSNKKINIPISSLSSDEIYALLDSIESDEEEDIENLMNDSDTEFVDRSVVENKDSDMHVDEEPETTSNDAHSNLIPTHLPIQAVVRRDVPEEESSDDEPFITLAKQKEPVRKWRKRFAKTPLQPCSLKEEGVVNMQTENVTPFEAFGKCIGLPGLLSMLKIESERYAAQNGRQFQISEEEFCAFLGVNLLMGINKFPTMKSYWSADEGLRNSLTQKAMTRARFLEILQNIHFADNHKALPPKESEEYDHAWKLRPLFDHLGKHFQDMLQPEAHQSIDEHMCKFKGKIIMRQYMKNKPIKWAFKFWFRCGAKSGYLYEFDMYLGKKVNTEFDLGEFVVLSLCQKLKDTHCFVFFSNFFTSPALLVKVLEMGIYATGTVRANRKNIPVLKHDREMKHCEHDWFSSNHLSAIKWMDNKSFILLSNYFNQKETQQIERRVKRSKDAHLPLKNTISSWKVSTLAIK